MVSYTQPKFDIAERSKVVPNVLLCKISTHIINAFNHLSSSSFSSHATQEHGLSDAGQGRADRWSDREHKRVVLLGTGSSVAAQLHLQVQSDRRGGAEETVPARVPQRLLVVSPILTLN